MHLQITILTEQLKLSQEQFGKCDTSKSILFIGIIWQYVPKKSHYQKNNCVSTDTLLYYFPRAQSINSPIHNFGFPTPLLTNITSSITIDPLRRKKRQNKKLNLKNISQGTVSQKYCTWHGFISHTTVMSTSIFKSRTTVTTHTRMRQMGDLGVLFLLLINSNKTKQNTNKEKKPRQKTKNKTKNWNKFWQGTVSQKCYISRGFISPTTVTASFIIKRETTIEKRTRNRQKKKTGLLKKP